MAKKQELKEFYRPEEVTADVLQGVIDEREPRRKPMMQYVEAQAHDGELIEVPILIQQRERFANITGFSDSSVLVRGMKTEKKLVAPFHVKNAYEFKATEDEDNLRRTGDGARDYEVSQEGLVEATDDLEGRRENLQFWAIAAMVNDKQFTYDDGDKVISISYAEEILDLTNPGTALNDAGADPYYETDIMKDEFYAATGQQPTLAFINGPTSATFKSHDKVQAGLTPQQPSDPDPSGPSFSMFEFNGITWVVIHDRYPLLTGGQKAAVDNGYAIMTVLQDQRGGGMPMKIHRAANILNRNNPAGPSYDSFIPSEDPFTMAVRLYDNMIPGVSRKGIVQKWKMW
jgi:hypothetical protein